MRRALALTACLVLSLGAAACGDDDEELDLGDEPTIEVPDASTETTGAEPVETPAEEIGEEGASEETDVEGTGGVAVPVPGKPDYDPGDVDSAENDKPPAPGTPEAAFEEACGDKPAACD